MSSIKKILYSGPLTYGQTCEMRRNALERLGHKTIPVDVIKVFSSYTGLSRKVQWRLRKGAMISNYNNKLIKSLNSNDIDIVWLDKAMFVQPAFYKQAVNKGIEEIIHYSPDNYFLPQNSSRHLWRSLKYISLVVTTKDHNVKKLKELGARNVFLSGNAYDPEIHKPIKMTGEELTKYGSDISFIGRWEPDREELIEKLLSFNYDVKVWGSDWRKCRSEKVRKVCNMNAVLGIEYSKVINASKINLGLLSKLAHDSITQRSIEIPACGSFLLAERTDEHKNHFDEGIEAEFYKGDDELIDKIKFYLKDSSKRKAIAEAGRKRCLYSGYSYQNRIADILKYSHESK